MTPPHTCRHTDVLRSTRSAFTNEAGPTTDTELKMAAESNSLDPYMASPLCNCVTYDIS